MACYNEWYSFVEYGTPEYLQAKAVVAAKLKALQHAIDYYYRAAGTVVPPAYPNPAGGYGGAEFTIEQPGRAEDEVLDRVTHHFACDGVYFTTIYDTVSLLDLEIPEQAGYARVLQTCAYRLRMMAGSEHASPDELFSLLPKRWYAAEFIGDDLQSDDPHRFSPIYIYEAHALKTGAGILRVAFWHENDPRGAQRVEGDWRVLERTPGLLLARTTQKSVPPVRLVHVRELSWKWLGDRFRIYPKPDETDVQERMGER